MGNMALLCRWQMIWRTISSSQLIKRSTAQEHLKRGGQDVQIVNNILSSPQRRRLYIGVRHPCKLNWRTTSLFFHKELHLFLIKKEWENVDKRLMIMLNRRDRDWTISLSKVTGLKFLNAINSCTSVQQLMNKYVKFYKSTSHELE